MIYCGHLIYSTVFISDILFQVKFWGRTHTHTHMHNTSLVLVYSQWYVAGLVQQNLTFKEYRNSERKKKLFWPIIFPGISEGLAKIFGDAKIRVVLKHFKKTCKINICTPCTDNSA